ncbi:MAG: molybdenum cofactor biosynthesis protein MoaE [Thermoproteota archaeon]
MIKITEEDFSIDDIALRLRDGETGAIVFFLGIVKAFREGCSINELIIEAYREVEEEKLKEIRTKALEKFNVNNIVIIHRVGRLKPLENIVLVAVSAKSRKEAFEACSWVIDEVKAQAPIWKKEITPKGGRWVKEGFKIEQ